MKLAGAEAINGREAWVIDLTPRAGARPRIKGPSANLLKLFGKLWIDKQEERIVRVEAEARETLTFGLILARLEPGSRIAFEKTLVNNEVWLPSRSFGRLTARILGVKRLAVEQTTTFGNYRKFQSDSRVFSTGDAPQP